jgi:hypothetical protein
MKPASNRCGSAAIGRMGEVLVQNVSWEFDTDGVDVVIAKLVGPRAEVRAMLEDKKWVGSTLRAELGDQILTIVWPVLVSFDPVIEVGDMAIVENVRVRGRKQSRLKG